MSAVKVTINASLERLCLIRFARLGYDNPMKIDDTIIQPKCHSSYRRSRHSKPCSELPDRWDSVEWTAVIQ